MARRDQHTFDLFDYEPPAVAPVYPPEVTAAATHKTLMCKTLSCALERDNRSREDIAKLLSDSLGESGKEGQLANWASPAKETHNIPAYKLMALIQILQTGRPANAIELLNSLLQDTGLIVCESKYRDLIDSRLMLDAADKMKEAADLAAAKWKAQS